MVEAMDVGPGASPSPAASASASAPRTSGGLFVGIDPGKAGFAVLLSHDATSIVDVVPAPLAGDGYDEPEMLRRAMEWRGRVALALIEDQVAYPDQNPRSMLTTGYGLGLWIMALTAAGVPTEKIAPRAWKGSLGVLAPMAKKSGAPKFEGLPPKELRRRAATLRRRIKDEGYVPDAREQELLAVAKATSDRSASRRKEAKALSVAKATALFPTYNFRASPRAKVPHDGMCEAALLAVVAARRYRGER
jgi:hypothetical protein